MTKFDRNTHWQSIYNTKDTSKVSWYQENPQVSLDFIRGANLQKDAAIIDIGGGDCRLVDSLLDEGFSNVTVLDISEKALTEARKRLGERQNQVSWIVADAASFTPVTKYDFWHDRAAFHFLNDENEIRNYVKTAAGSVKPGAMMVIGTFSDRGPEKCSGITVRRYTAVGLSTLFNESFDLLDSFTTDHVTPSGKKQNFLFCSFRRQ